MTRNQQKEHDVKVIDFLKINMYLYFVQGFKVLILACSTLKVCLRMTNMVVLEGLTMRLLLFLP
jgi:hypothetical protein